MLLLLPSWNGTWSQQRWWCGSPHVVITATAAADNCIIRLITAVSITVTATVTSTSTNLTMTTMKWHIAMLGGAVVTTVEAPA